MLARQAAVARRGAVITRCERRACPLCRTERFESHSGAADPDAIAQPRREPIVHEHAQRLPHARNVRKPIVELANIKQPRMGLEERAQDGALSKVVVGHPPSLHERVFAKQEETRTFDSRSVG